MKNLGFPKILKADGNFRSGSKGISLDENFRWFDDESFCPILVSLTDLAPLRDIGIINPLLVIREGIPIKVNTRNIVYEKLKK